MEMIIKPSSPTPDHLKNVKLSLVDQVSPPVFIPLVFFYESNLNFNTVEISKSLRQSLSNILTIFYPLAGRLNQEQSSIDCNDEGVIYVEAHVHIRLSEVIHDPKMEQLTQFLPVHPLDLSQKSILNVKVNYFTCGGIAIGICLSHKIADGSSMVAFINAWAAICRGEAASKVMKPSFDFAVHFPPRKLYGLSLIPSTSQEKILTRRFVFDKEKLEKLRNIAVSEEVKIPTKVETITAFIINRVVAETEKTMFFAVHAVNLRQRMIPKLSEHEFGNCYAVAIVLEPEDISIPRCAKKLREAIRKIDNEFIMKVQSGEYLNHVIKTVELFGKMESLCFTSWSRFPLYEVDFGWGKPIWVCPVVTAFKNSVVLTTTSCGEGIEAWVNLVEEDMIKLLDM